ncbi:hypothetical protein HAZT_HAZT005991 [Hyalella azteca]|uniref:UDP-glycosyltransferase n=1 Tax=Hyalella azteca TaxID=294128 RepID=A0A6A0GQD3_HYAAZ|nr:hypothetical protein HAZT_HAZT005991 [Hyalella azteca]
MAKSRPLNDTFATHRMVGLRVLVLVVLAGALQAVGAALPPPERSYNILMLLPVSSKSHRNVFMPLAKALTQRGHKVTMLSNSPLSEAEEIPGLTHYENPLVHFKIDTINTFDMMDDHEKMFKMFNERLPLMARDIYDVPIVKNLYNRRKEFDVILLDSIFNEVMYPFTFNHTFIAVSTGGLDPTMSSIMGNTLNPAYITKRFPDLPSFREMARNVSLTLMNSHFSTSLVVPLLPNQVEVGGLHIEPTKRLPKDLSDFLSGTTPVVYMSLGSVARSSAMPQEYKDIFFSAFAKLPYKVLWKFEEEPQQKLKNVFVQKWMPQQDILAAMKDRPMSAVETAVYWTEYVIRHQGAVHLRSPERDLTWVQLLHLDLLLLLHVALLLIYVAIWKFVSFCFGRKDRGNKSKRKNE